MSVFDIANPPATPDSDLDSDLTNAHNFSIENANVVSIAPGDWVDVDPNALTEDPTWGFSFQVCNVYPNADVGQQQVGILYSTDNGTTYAEIQLATAWVTNNFRRQPFIV